MLLTCEAILFDLDGVLLDSRTVAERHLRAWADHHEIPFERIVSIYHGRTTVETIQLVAPHLDARHEAVLMEEAESADIRGVTAFAGASRLLVGMPADRWAIVTSCSRATALSRLAHVGLPVPSVLITADDAERGKPAPDPYLMAAARLGRDITKCVVVEDAPSGVTSGMAAGACVIGVASTVPAVALAFADHVVACIDDLGAELVGNELRLSWRETV